MNTRSLDSLISRLGLLVQWTVFVLGLSFVFHILVLLAIPNITVLDSSKRIADAGGVNQALHFGRYQEDAWTNGRLTNPDILTSACAFNLALGPVRLAAKVPDTLWSVSIYSDSRELIYRLDESDISGGVFEAVVAGTGQQFPNDAAVLEIHIARFTGLVVFRSLVDFKSDLKPQQALNETTRCEALNNALSKRHD